MRTISLARTPALFLVGGMGTRLRSVVASSPKPLAPVGDESFLHLLVRQAGSQGIRNIVMCTGYRAEQIEAEFGDGADLHVQISYSREDTALGTAGAIRLARKHVQDATDFLVLNGDSFVQMDFAELVRHHGERGGIATMAVHRVDDAARYGTVEVDANGRVVGFLEKTGKQSPGLINAGVYVFRSDLLEIIPGGPSSLEKDVFPTALSRGIYALEQHGLFIDIGTPEDYARARQMRECLAAAAKADSGRGV